MDELTELRKEIDSIDTQIARLFEKRIAVASEIGKIKKRKGLPITDPDREKIVCEAFAAKCKPEHKRDAQFLCACLISAAKKEERETE